MIFSPERLITYHPQEQLVSVVREYGITRLPQLTIDVLIYLAAWFFMYPLLRLGNYGLLTWIVLVVAAVVLSFRHFVSWYGDCSIITNQRIIDVDRRGIFQTTVREIAWEQIKDVQFSQRGVLATLLSYGTITIFTADASPMEWQHVYQPNRLRDILSEYVPTLH